MKKLEFKSFVRLQEPISHLNSTDTNLRHAGAFAGFFPPNGGGLYLDASQYAAPAVTPAPAYAPDATVTPSRKAVP